MSVDGVHLVRFPQPLDDQGKDTSDAMNEEQLSSRLYPRKCWDKRQY